MADAKPSGNVALADKLLRTLHKDRDRLLKIQRYIDGDHDDPYMPTTADAEYKLLAQRAITNTMPLLVGTPAQALYVDNVRRSDKSDDSESTSAEWEHWQYSRLDSRQSQVVRAALGYGHSFTLTEKVEKNGKERIRSRGLSPLTTAALFEDPANDIDPEVALHVTKEPEGDERGTARMWDLDTEYEVTFKSYDDWESIEISEVGKHDGDGECPVTRFAASIDLDGRTVGVVEPFISMQDRINQTVFDLLVAQTYGSFKVRYVTGMAPPLKMKWVDEDGNTVKPDDPKAVERVPELDPETGNPIPERIDHNARRFLFAEDDDVNFGSLDETPLGGFIESLEAAFRQLAALTQTPPNHLLGEMANLSAEALLAAENSLSRKVQEFRNVFGEAWERVFRLAAKMAGQDGAEDFAREVLWRDTELRSLSQSADALGKIAEQLRVPVRGLWARIPGATKGEIDEWNRLFEQEDSERMLAEAATRASQIRSQRQQSDVVAEPDAA